MHWPVAAFALLPIVDIRSLVVDTTRPLCVSQSRLPAEGRREYEIARFGLAACLG